MSEFLDYVRKKAETDEDYRDSLFALEYINTNKEEYVNAVATLTLRKQRIIRDRFGWNEEAKTGKAIGAELGISTPRVYTLEREALIELMQKLKPIINKVTYPYHDFRQQLGIVGHIYRPEIVPLGEAKRSWWFINIRKKQILQQIDSEREMQAEDFEPLPATPKREIVSYMRYNGKIERALAIMKHFGGGFRYEFQEETESSTWKSSVDNFFLSFDDNENPDLLFGMDTVSIGDYVVNDGGIEIISSDEFKENYLRVVKPIE